MSRISHVRTPTQADLERALRLLEERGSWGIPRRELPSLFGSDRFGRRVMAELRERGMAAVVVVPDPTGRETYRIAQDEAELRRYIAQLEARIERLQAAVYGLRVAWAAGGSRRAQEPLLPLEPEDRRQQ